MWEEILKNKVMILLIIIMIIIFLYYNHKVVPCDKWSLDKEVEKFMEKQDKFIDLIR